MSESYTNPPAAGQARTVRTQTSFSLRLEPEDIATLRDVAAKEERTVSQLVRLILRRACEERRAEAAQAASN